MHYDLGYIDLEQKTLQTINSPFGTRVSPSLRNKRSPISPGRTAKKLEREKGFEPSTVSTDLHPVIVLMTAANIDISALANPASITVNAKVYPCIGGAASVADSSVLSAGARGFTPQIH